MGKTFSTQLVIDKNFVQNQNEIKSHFDKEDFITCIITFGDPLYGGDTVNYTGINQGTSSDIEQKYLLSLLISDRFI